MDGRFIVFMAIWLTACVLLVLLLKRSERRHRANYDKVKKNEH